MFMVWWRQWHDGTNRGAVRGGIDLERTTKECEALPHPEDSHARARLPLPEQCQHVVGNTRSWIGDLQNESVLIDRKSDRGGLATGVPENVGQAFLNDSE